MSHSNFLSDDIFDQRCLAGLNWLKRSIDKTGTPGSSIYYSRIFKPLNGWANPYPETTGYIIKTFIDFQNIYPNLHLNEYAHKAARWICSLQFENGALPGGAFPSNTPSVFNSGQMLIGLLAAYEDNQNEMYLNTVERSVSWLMSILEEDGSWQQGSYMKGWIPSYYTRVIWPVLWANKYIKSDEIEAKMLKALKYYEAKINLNHSVEDWSFKSGQRAFTHTIAYTIRGFMESSFLLNDIELMQKSFEMGEKIMRLREVKGSLAGWYDQQWRGSYWFTCLTGNAQLSIILSKMYFKSNDVRYLNTSLKIFNDIVHCQKLSDNKNINGALPGSNPIYGRYLIFRYPNWAVKFYLDAFRLLKSGVSKIQDQNL